jgi:hypothetical protein
MGAGPLAMPSANPGEQAKALTQVREALKILEGALPNLGSGTKPYTAVLKAISDINKHVAAGNEVPGVQQTALRDLSQQAQKNGMLQSLVKSMGSSGTGGNAPGAPSLPASSGGGAPGAALPPA